MKRFLCLVLLAGFARDAARAAAAPDSEDRTVNGVMVIVNKEVITRKDVMHYIGSAVETLMARYRNQPALLNEKLNDVLREGLEQLVERRLILHEFETAGYNLPESIIEDRVRERIREEFGDRATMTKTLNGRGQSYENYKREIREEFIIGLMRSMKVSRTKIVISPHKIEKYYADHLDQFKVGDAYKLRSIMISRGGKSSPDAAAKLAAEIVAKLKDGASFAEMAAIYSEDSFRSKGGERDWVELEKEHYHRQLEDAIKSLQPGQRSDVIEAGEAYWIILVEEVKPNHYRALNDVRDEVEKTLTDQESTRLRKQWIDQLKAKSFVRYF